MTVSLVGKDQLEILDGLKATCNKELAELRAAHAELQDSHKDLETDVDVKKSLLNTVLLDKDAVTRKVFHLQDQILEREQDLSEMQSTISAFRGSADGRDAALEERVQKLQEKLEKRRLALNKSSEVKPAGSSDRQAERTNGVQHVKKQNEIIKELKEQLETTIAADTNEKLASMEERLSELKVSRPAPSTSNNTLISAHAPPHSIIIGNLLTFLAYRAEKERLGNRAAGARELAARYGLP